MAARRPAFLDELGLTLQAEDLYWRVHGRTGEALADVAAILTTTPERLRADLAPLVALQAVEVDADDRLVVPEMGVVVSRLLADEGERMRVAARRVEQLAAAVPFVAPPAPEVSADGTPLSGARVEGVSAPHLMARWIEESSGELMFLRPDQWRTRQPAALADALAEAIAAGRTARAIYPARALEEAPETLAERARMGEQIRVLAQVPTRLFVVPGTHALVPYMPGYASPRLLVVRERGLVLMLARLFEQLWERALPVPDLDLRGARDKGRRLLLQLLATGAGDEQIARSLGVSLRTVRRRVADLLIELGADSRFQAGVEAARRGWL
ncbi:helix-turn-helix domain-containing protein [Nocardioides sp. ChNu-153]|uniref:helix-turn-helix domain-containing protein n=1 Tax=unclassified Nocardioides TaxID=2615069 RepID=UPI0024052016|nr:MULTISPECIES: helix-turn-helix domain-containing protein [unclassified Nocardioides]MDF9717935.1 helix-turn-helix domain-containing protein [Nocardioides sp. ChNu-99]MDN7123258.1 helix-turn-helix domain-containing protein [Nocardioides sp. ChNu-153]